MVEFRPDDWAEKYFSAQSAMKSSGNSVAFLHEVVFFIDRPSCLARATGRLLWRVSEKKKNKSGENENYFEPP